jgi:UDP-N-acetylmuramate dehydrogenase
MQISENFSLKTFNTFGLDVNARYFCEFSSENELAELLMSPLLLNYQHLMIGRGSNLLFVSDFDGVVLHSDMRGIHVRQQNDSRVLLEVESGVLWDDLVACAVEQGWQGIENLSLIPGETGAAAVQNIGAYGVELKEFVRSVRALSTETAEVREFTLDECGYAYRESVFKKHLRGKYIISSVKIELNQKPLFNLSYQHLESEVLKRGEINLQNVRKTVIDIRESKLPDPKVLGNAGSFFMNPVVDNRFFDNLKQQYPDIPHYLLSSDEIKIPAGWLIERCGWKGKTVGNAGVHDKQALVLVNRGGATGSEIASLAEMIQKDVRLKTGIDLVPEVNMIG